MPDKIHLTVATVVEHNQQFLMVEEYERGQLLINQPAGHVEPGEDVMVAAIRETREETGWEVSLTGFLGLTHYHSPHNGITYYRLGFSAKPVTHHPEELLDPDIHACKWMSYDQIIASSGHCRSPLVIAAIEQWRANHIFPLGMIQTQN